jgi:hypothetical protein
VADRADDLKALLKSAGYDKLTAFRARQQQPTPIAW